MRIFNLVLLLLASSGFLVVSVAGFSTRTNNNSNSKIADALATTFTSRSPVASNSRPTTATARSSISTTSLTTPFRTRKQISEFRRRRLSRDPTFRVSAHICVDGFDTAKLFPAILESLPSDWQGDDFYDGVRLWRQDPTQNNGVNGESPIGKVSLSAADSVLETPPLPPIEQDSPQVFVFRFGAVVFWNFVSPLEEQMWLEEYLLKENDSFAGVRYKQDAAEDAADEIAYTYYASNNNDDQPAWPQSFKGNTVQLTTRESGEKLAISFALAKSTLLSMYEWRLQRTIERNAHIPEQLALNGKIEMSLTDIQKEVGRIFLVKHGINLDSSMIDTPEEFWEDSRFQGIYESGIRYFDIPKRLSLVNNRLDTVKELTDVLSDAAENRHSEFLEWIIIILIVVEVVLDLFGLGIELRH